MAPGGHAREAGFMTTAKPGGPRLLQRLGGLLTRLGGPPRPPAAPDGPDPVKAADPRISRWALGIRLAEVLRSVADPPNRRLRPLPGDRKGLFDFWFDGGAAVGITGGGTTFQFDDGAVAQGPYRMRRDEPWTMRVRLGDGTRILIKDDGSEPAGHGDAGRR
jgi:hypothetical protein